MKCGSQNIRKRRPSDGNRLLKEQTSFVATSARKYRKKLRSLLSRRSKEILPVACLLGLAQLVDRDSLYARAGNGRARVNKPFRIDNLSVFLNFVHQAALMIWNERRKRELPLLGDSASNLFRDRFAILGR